MFGGTLKKKKDIWNVLMFWKLFLLLMPHIFRDWWFWDVFTYLLVGGITNYAMRRIYLCIFPKFTRWAFRVNETQFLNSKISILNLRLFCCWACKWYSDVTWTILKFSTIALRRIKWFIIIFLKPLIRFGFFHWDLIWTFSYRR